MASHSFSLFGTVLLGAVFLLPTLTYAQSQPRTYSEDCISHVDNATIYVPDSVSSTLPTGASIETNDTLAVYTSDGTCAGFGIWTGKSPPPFPAAGSDSTEPGPEGFSDGDQLRFEVFDASADTALALDTDVEYASCEDVPVSTCRNNGTYKDGTIHKVTTLGSPPEPSPEPEPEPEPVTQSITFKDGANLVSSRIAPTDSSIESVVSDIDSIKYVARNLIASKKAKEKLRTYPKIDKAKPLETWLPSRAHVIIGKGKGELEITGSSLPADYPIELKKGLNVIPFYPKEPMEASTAFASLIEEGIFEEAQSGSGDDVYKEGELDSMDPLVPGKGYLIRVSKDATFSYPVSR